MTNFEIMKEVLPPDTGIETVVRVIAGSADGRCAFCAYSGISEDNCKEGNCRDGIREWLLSENKGGVRLD